MHLVAMTRTSTVVLLHTIGGVLYIRRHSYGRVFVHVQSPSIHQISILLYSRAA